MEYPTSEKRVKNKRTKVKYSCPSYSDLPRNVTERILLLLSVKSIFVCKGVCKTWNNIISDPDFAKLHFNQAEVYPLLQTSGFTVLSRMLYLVQPERNDFELKLDCDRYSPEHNLGCSCNVKFKLNAKFRLPLHNPQMIVNDRGDEARRNNCLKLNMRDHKYKIVNSCNGFLCLCDPSNNEPMVVCNPITGEFIDLPVDSRTKDFDSAIACGFGFSPKTNQYNKVIKMFMHCIGEDRRVVVAEVHILGTNSWKNIGVFPYSVGELPWPSYLNGNLYWYNYDRPSVVFFDIEKDCFGSFSTPLESCKYGILGFGVLGGELCLSESFYGDRIDFWVMKERKDWLKMLSIDMLDHIRWPWGSYQPIKYLNNGALLLYNSHEHVFVYHNPKNLGYRYLEVRGMQSKVEAISHIPSFILLKDVVSEMTVLNVRSRCGELKLYKEGKGISIVEQFKDRHCDCGCEEIYGNSDSE